MSEPETNELSRSAMGGTEQMLARLHRDMPPELLERVQVIPTRVRELDPDRKRILWVHDTWNDPEVRHLNNPALVSRFDAIVFVSHHQRNSFLDRMSGIPRDRTRVIRNGIEPFDPSVAENLYPHDGIRPVRLIYHTTPHRGLDVLINTFIRMSDVDAELDVYSSFGIYGWHKRDIDYLNLFDLCREHPRINYHGHVPNERIRSALVDCDVFAYPSTWPETSCLAAIEAMGAGCRVVTTDLAALPETTAGYARLVPYIDDHYALSDRYERALREEIGRVSRTDMDLRTELYSQVSYARRMYDWNRIRYEWMDLFTEVVNGGGS